MNCGGDHPTLAAGTFITLWETVVDLVKSNPVQAVKPAEAPKKSAQKPNPEADAVVLAAKKATQQTPRPTTNMRGETLGLLLNVAA